MGTRILIDIFLGAEASPAQMQRRSQRETPSPLGAKRGRQAMAEAAKGLMLMLYGFGRVPESGRRKSVLGVTRSKSVLGVTRRKSVLGVTARKYGSIRELTARAASSLPS